MSMLSPISHRTGAGPASAGYDNRSTLAGWGLLIDGSLTIVRNRLEAKLTEADHGGNEAERAELEAALAECDSIQLSTAALIVPYRAEYQSILGHLVAELEAAVADAENSAKLSGLQAHKARLDELMTVGTLSHDTAAPQLI